MQTIMESLLIKLRDIYKDNTCVEISLIGGVNKFIQIIKKQTNKHFDFYYICSDIIYERTRQSPNGTIGLLRLGDPNLLSNIKELINTHGK